MNKTLIIGLIVMAAHYISAGIQDVGTQVFKAAVEYPKTTNIAFELRNKSSNQIWSAVRNGSDLSPVKQINPRDFWQLAIDPKFPTNVIIWYTNPGLITGKVVPFTLSPRPDKVYGFTSDKTMYVTWDDKRNLRPQTGPLAGITGKTDSNLSLARNVKNENIQDIDISRIKGAIPVVMISETIRQALGLSSLKPKAWEVLGMQSTENILDPAVEENQKRAYKMLQLKWHPDKVSADKRNLATEVTQALNDARDVLNEARENAKTIMSKQ
jgi:hypothetical protein